MQTLPPEPAWYVPITHEVHASEPASAAKVPAEQGVQAAAPDADAVPRAHEEHWSMPPTDVAIENFPPGQLGQADEPAAAW